MTFFSFTEATIHEDMSEEKTSLNERDGTVLTVPEDSSLVSAPPWQLPLSYLVFQFQGIQCPFLAPQRTTHTCGIHTCIHAKKIRHTK